ncbi:MAG TPA: methyltransferase domain-containing protein [Acidimicrobiales bacterium]|nr:methyltransferase domain-containing protein [Acidimicrobiales bacterium]
MSGPSECALCAFGAAPGTLVTFDSIAVTAPEDAPVTSLLLVSRHHAQEPFELLGLHRRRFWEETMIVARALKLVTGAPRLEYEISGGASPHVQLELRARQPDPTMPATRDELANTILRLADPDAQPVDAADVPAVYDAMSEWWDHQAEDGFYNAHYDRPAVLELCGDVSGLRVADLGCGTGLYIVELVARGAHVVGVDGSAEQLTRARARLGPEAELIQHDLERPLTMFADESFDAVVMPLVYHHIDDRIGLLGEIRRMLRPGGWLVLSTSHPTSDWLQSGGSYFTVERVDAFFDGLGGRWRVPFWRLPMGALLDEIITAGLVLDRLFEPVPPPDRAWVSPRMHRRLTLEPAFVAIRAHRPA